MDYEKTNKIVRRRPKVLVVVAHPDDEILGVGGLITKHVEFGDEVYVCVVTKAWEPFWSEEYIKRQTEVQDKVDKFLGVTKRIRLDLPTVKLNTLPHGELNQMICDVVNMIEPRIIYTHFEHDINYDHRLVFRACQVAVRPPKIINLYSFETPSETEWGSIRFNPNAYINITNQIGKKLKALQHYNYELKDSPHPRSIEGVKNLARRRGFESCFGYAEALMIIRDMSE